MVFEGLQTIAEFARNPDIDRQPRTIQKWIKAGLPVIRIGGPRGKPLIDPAKARKWFEDGMPGPTSARPARHPRRAA